MHTTRKHTVPARVLRLVNYSTPPCLMYSYVHRRPITMRTTDGTFCIITCFFVYIYSKHTVDRESYIQLCMHIPLYTTCTRV